MEKFSLLEPEDCNDYYVLDEDTWNALSLDTLIDALTKNRDEKKNLREIIEQVPVRRSVIEYRRGIYQDLCNCPELFHELSEICKNMHFFHMSGALAKQKGSTLWDFIERINDLSNYCTSVIQIQECLEKYPVCSEGLNHLKGYVNEIYQDAGFPELIKDVEEMCGDIYNIKSMTLGVNLDVNLHPVSVGIISLNTTTMEEQGILKRYLSFVKEKMGTHDSSMAMLTHSKSLDTDEYQLRNNLTRLIERLLPKTIYKVQEILRKWVDTSGFMFTQLADDFLFYRKFYELQRRLTEAGLPSTLAEISSEDIEMKNFYNIRLALSKIYDGTNMDVVCNDIRLDSEHAVLILTGPNRGGKTVLTQGIGLAQLLFQLGVFTTCERAAMRICDGIFMHFPADENNTMKLGRLGEEAECFAYICRHASGKSLVLLNESFASTSHTESIIISKDIIRYLCSLGAYACFNTHVHELGEIVEDINAFDGIKGNAVSVVMENKEGKRMYKIVYRKPDMQSYAYDIAYKYGITYEQLLECKKAKSEEL